MWFSVQMANDFCTLVAKLYLQGCSSTEISKELGCSVHKVMYWLEKAGVARRTPSEALYAKYNPQGDPFTIKSPKTHEDIFLYGLGLGLYWGEGNKACPSSVRLSNTDPDIILSFLRFLECLCGVKPEKIKYNIVCFNDSNPIQVGEYWAKILNVPIKKFGKIVQIPPQGKGTYKRKSQFGVCTICVYNTKFKQWMLKELRKLHTPG